jgi:hypothetical protein
MKQNQRNFWLDISLFVTFLSTIITGVTLWLLIPHQAAAVFLGIDRHSWLTVHIYFGLASSAGSVLHVIWHRKWFKALRKRPVASLPPKLRANRVVDRFIWTIFLAASGFGALDWILPMGTNKLSIASRLHVAFGIALLLGITVHLALHKHWITSASMRYLRVKEGYGASSSNNL